MRGAATKHQLKLGYKLLKTQWRPFMSHLTTPWSPLREECRDEAPPKLNKPSLGTLTDALREWRMKTFSFLYIIWRVLLNCVDQRIKREKMQYPYIRTIDHPSIYLYTQVNKPCHESQWPMHVPLNSPAGRDRGQQWWLDSGQSYIFTKDFRASCLSQTGAHLPTCLVLPLWCRTRVAP